MTLTVVVVDNNSTDDTAQVISSFIAESKLSIRSLFVAQPGKSAALNHAISQSDSELVGMIDDDEQIDSQWLQVIFKEFSQDSELEYIGGPYHPDWELEAHNEWLTSTYPGVVGIVRRPVRTPFTREFGGMLMGGNAVISRATLLKVMPYPEEIGKIGTKILSGEDEVIYHRLLDLKAKGMAVPELIVFHWIPAKRTTKKYFRQWIVGRGISVGYQFRQRKFAGTILFGIPRYMFGDAARSLKPIITTRSPRERFLSELSILDCCATFYGRHLWRPKTRRPSKRPALSMRLSK
jgi:glucosyl-dolichyl phosphate glucuronosyltransferase